MTNPHARAVPAPLLVTQTEWSDTVALKIVVLVLAVVFIAAPFAYGAYMINGMTALGMTVWRWPVFAVLAVILGLLSWWVVLSLRRKFPYS